MTETMPTNDDAANGGGISLQELFVRFRWRILGTWSLVCVEAGLMLLFPLVIGIAIDRMIQQEYSGLFWLAGVGFGTVLIGSARRFYDTRLYSKIYIAASEQIVEQERDRKTDVSRTSARTNMVTELVEFFETSFPGIIDCVIGLGGALLMIWFLQSDVFNSCLVATGLIVAIYAVTSKTTYDLNKGFNEQSESQVTVLSEGTMPEVSLHFSSLMRWNIRLSDLETVNFALSWVVMIVVLVYSVAITIQSGVTSQGRVLAILMYVFGYIESVVTMPLFYQQFVRLREIGDRFASVRSNYEPA